MSFAMFFFIYRKLIWKNYDHFDNKLWLNTKVCWILLSLITKDQNRLETSAIFLFHNKVNQNSIQH